MEILGIAEITIKKWRAEQSWKEIKVSRVERRKMRYWPERLIAFLSKTGKGEYLEKLEKWTNGKDKKSRKRKPAAKKVKVSVLSGIQKKTGTTKKATGKKDPGREHLKDEEPENFHPVDIGLIADEEVNVFTAKKIIGKLLVSAANRLLDADKNYLIASESNNIAKLTNQLHHLETVCMDVDERLGKIVPVADVKLWIGQMFTRIKTDLRAMPYAVAEEVAAVCNYDNPKEIAEVIKAKVDDSLRHLADNVRDLQKTQ